MRVLAIIPLAALAVSCKPADPYKGANCITRMKMIHGAIATWAVEHKKSTNDVVTWSDLVGPDKYLRVRPTCPRGGTYSITTAGAGPSCSIADDMAYYNQLR